MLTADSLRGLKRFLNRIAPAVLQRLDVDIKRTTRRPLIALYIDDQSIAADCSDLYGWNTGIPGSIHKLFGDLRLDRQHRTRLALSEEKRITA